MSEITKERLAALIGVGVKVKPLEWELLGGRSWRAKALLFGSFRVERYADGYIVMWSVPGYSDAFVEGRWPTAEEAKAAAQADYEQRILAALETSPLYASPRQKGRGPVLNTDNMRLAQQKRRAREAGEAK